MKTPLARLVKFTDDRRSKPQQAAAGYRGDDMKFSTLSKAGFAASLCAALTGWSTGVQAGTLQDTIFAKVEPSVRDRMFFRLSYIVANVKTTAKDAYDVTGPVLAKGDTTLLGANGNTFFYSDAGDLNYQVIAPLMDSATNGAFAKDKLVCARYGLGLGTPCGIKGKGSDRVSTPALSLGYYFDNGKNWVAEAFLLAAPISAEVFGDGRNQLNGKKIIETKLLPPIVTLGYYFGGQDTAFRPYVGVAASYAIFYGAKATQALNEYQGGAGSGDTKVSIKNSYGFGPFIGMKFEPKDSDWHFSLNVGKLRYRAQATLTTYNTVITSETPVVKDFGPQAQLAITKGDAIFDAQSGVRVFETGSPVGYNADEPVGITTALMCDLAKLKYGNNECNHGTFVRRADTILDNTMFMFSVGRSF
jgi:outer membrane protein W